MDVLEWIVLATLAVLALSALVDRVPPAWAMAIFAAAIPLSLIFRSSGADRASPFSLVKMAAVGAGAVYVSGAKITRWTARPAGRAVGFAILAGNILEAVIAEVAQGGLLNAAAGLLLVLTQAGPGTIDVARGERGAPFRYRLGGLWLAAYVVWNFTFVYGRESHGAHAGYAAMAAVHLGVPLLAMRGRSELFIQYRAHALTVMMVVRLVAPYPPFLVLSPHWYSPTIASALHVLSFGLAAIVAARAVARARRTRIAGDAMGWAALRPS